MAFIGSVLLPMGGIYFPFALIGAVFLSVGISRFVRENFGVFLLGLLLAILGGYWSKRVLDTQGLELFRMLPTAFVSTIGLYLQYLVYETIGEKYKVDTLTLGALLLVIGSATFWFYVGFLPLAVGTVLVAYSFWRLRDA